MAFSQLGWRTPASPAHFVRNPEKLARVEAETPDHATVGGRSRAGADDVPPGPAQI